MMNQKVYKELVKQHIDIPYPEFQIVLSYDIGIILKLVKRMMK